MVCTCICCRHSNSSKLGDGFVFNSEGEEDDGESDDDDDPEGSNGSYNGENKNHDAGANKSVAGAAAAGSAAGGAGGGTKKGKHNNVNDHNDRSFFAKASDDHDSAGGTSRGGSRSGGSGSVGGGGAGAGGHKRGRSAPDAGEMLGGREGAASLSDVDTDDRTGPWENGSDDSSSDGVPRGSGAGSGRISSAKDLRLEVGRFFLGFILCLCLCFRLCYKVWRLREGGWERGMHVGPTSYLTIPTTRLTLWSRRSTAVRSSVPTRSKSRHKRLVAQIIYSTFYQSPED